jgi:hypothetical protein
MSHNSSSCSLIFAAIKWKENSKIMLGSIQDWPIASNRRATLFVKDSHEGNTGVHTCRKGGGVGIEFIGTPLFAKTKLRKKYG